MPLIDLSLYTDIACLSIDHDSQFNLAEQVQEKLEYLMAVNRVVLHIQYVSSSEHFLCFIAHAVPRQQETIIKELS